MTDRIRRIAELEFANYAATAEVARVTPGLDLVLRESIIITSSEVLPIPDANHACLFRADGHQVDDLIDEIVRYFHSRGSVATLLVSPACRPQDLPARLLARGFVRQDGEEAWMAIDDLPSFRVPAQTPGVSVRSIARDESPVFAEVFLEAFEMPIDFAPAMAQLLAPSIGLDTTRHYVAWADGQPVGTCSLLLCGANAVLGSAGVIRSPHSRGAATSLGAAAAAEAQRRGARVLMLQTTAGTLFERFLRIRGFRRVFTRACYVLCPGVGDDDPAC